MPSEQAEPVRSLTRRIWLSLFFVCPLAWADDSGITPSAFQIVEEEDASPSCAGTILKVSNATLTDNADGSCSVDTGGGSGDVVTVNSTAIDTTANFKDTTTITWALIDGGAGGPDDAQATAVDVTCTGCLGTTEVAGLDISADTNLTAGDNLTLTDDDLDLDATVTIATSIASPIFASTTAGVAATGILRFANNEGINWEAAPAGTDCTLLTDASEILTSSCVFAATGGITIDATTEGNIETAIDTLSNLTAASALVTVGTITTGAWNAGAVTSSGLITGNANMTVGNGASAGTVTLLEGSGGGTNFKAFVAPAAITADTTCTFENDANFIPDSCVGDGVDDGGSETNSLEVITTGIASTEIPIGTAADTVVYAALSGEATMTNGGVVTLADSVTVTGWTLGTSSATTFTAGTVNVDLLDGVGAVDMDYGSADITDHTFITDGTGDAEIVLPLASVSLAETLLTAGRSLTLSTNDVLADAELYTDTKCYRVTFPTAADDDKSIWRNSTANAFDLTEIWAESDQTVTFMLQVDDGTPADVDTVNLAPAAGEAEDTSLNGDTQVAASEELDLAITSVANNPTWFTVCWTGTWAD